jgi:SAM-dependent methyltransferase
MAVLDVGGGRFPALTPEDRSPGMRYAGMDISGDELKEAPAGAYDEVIEGDIATRMPGLESRFDLILSHQLLEHVRPLDAAIENMRTYLRPGGRLITRLSGGRALSALLNRAVPPGLAVFALRVLLGREPHTVFPAHYDKCSFDELNRIMSSWSRVEMECQYLGADYFRFFLPLQSLYLLYERWAMRNPNLASNYLVDAVK